MFKKIWAWFNGNKTLFGALILTLVAQGVFGDSGFWFDLFNWLGGILAGVGVLHKVVKGVNNT